MSSVNLVFYMTTFSEIDVFLFFLFSTCKYDVVLLSYFNKSVVHESYKHFGYKMILLKTVSPPI